MSQGFLKWRRFEETLKNPLRWKTISLKSVYKGFLTRRKFEDTLENTLRWKTISFQSVSKAFSNGHHLKIHLRTHSGENKSSYWTWSWDHYNQFFVRFWHLLISFWHSTNYVLNHLAVLWYVRLSNKLFHA